jgi:serine protease Do
MNNNLKVVGIAVLSSIATIGGYKMLGFEQKDVIFSESKTPSINRLADYTPGVPGDFTYAAEVSTPSVVHIKATAVRSVRQRVNPFEDFFGGGGMDDFFGQGGGGGRSQSQESSGSGVIISADGYIATNNHVVEGAEGLEVILSDKKTYKAKVIGTDPSTDIAVIKIEATNLPAMPFANSDNVKVGEWVLAVGNPFNLESTVTAGIISAKGRNIGILGQKNQQMRRYDGKDQPTSDAIESFIQTDAAVNPGNSGGALVNLKGELIGINTAIASPNGAYAGYAFAVPASIVKKVTADITKYGNVQRGYLGISLRELDGKQAEEFNTKVSEGIYVADVLDNGAAKAAGVKKGDVITKIDGMEAISSPKFQELIGRKRPGETVVLTVNRDGATKEFSVTLRNRDGGKDLVKNDPGNKFYEKLGVELEELSSADKAKVGSGIRIKKVFDGEIANQTDLNEGFIIMKVGDKKVNTVAEFKKALQDAKDAGEDGVLIGGKYPNSSKTQYVGLGLQ